MAIACSDDSTPKNDALVADKNVTTDKAKTDGTTKDTGGSDKAKTDGTTKDTGGSLGSVKLCRPTCKTTTDCPKDSSTFKWTCGSDGYCKSVACSAKADCKLAILPECIDFGPQTTCLPKNCTSSSTCTSPDTCVAIFPTYKGCTSLLAECTSSTDCGTNTFKGYIAGQPHCDLKHKYCSCQTDKECQDARGTLIGGTWKCVDYTLSPWKAL